MGLTNMVGTRNNSGSEGEVRMRGEVKENLAGTEGTRRAWAEQQEYPKCAGSMHGSGVALSHQCIPQ